MTDAEKIIADTNKITEYDYKREHIFMWKFVINRIKDASLLVSDIKNGSKRRVSRKSKS